MNKLLIGAAALGFGLPALAQVAPMGDRAQTRDQVVAKVREHFAMLDTNRDGYIGTDEMQAMRGQHRPKMGQMPDGNGQDMAMRDGPMGNSNALFDRLDSNRDGMISRDEFAKGREMRVERKEVMNGGPGMESDDHQGMRKMHGMGGGMGGGMIKMADTNKDGRITLQEMTAAALQHFDRIDTNRDGRITPEERKAMHQQMMQERGRDAG